MIKKILLPILCCHTYIILNAQINLGWTLGVSVNWGSKVQRIGLKGSVFAYRDFVQMNVEMAGYYAWNSWGSDVSRWEAQVTGGVLGGWGRPDRLGDNPFIQDLQNQTERPYSLGYAYKMYFDNIETSQATGMIAIGVKNGRLIIENDIFAWAGEDKFRTSRIVWEYRHKNTLFAVRNFLWTGDPEFDIRPAVRDSPYPSRFGYYDLSECKYCDYSHGVLALQVRQSLPFRQTIQASFGVDSEHVRHIGQNKIIHDMASLSMRWILAENPHIPMLDENNEQYLFKEGQRVKPFQWFWDIGVN